MIVQISPNHAFTANATTRAVLKEVVCSTRFLRTLCCSLLIFICMLRLSVVSRFLSFVLAFSVCFAFLFSLVFSRCTLFSLARSRFLSFFGGFLALAVVFSLSVFVFSLVCSNFLMLCSCYLAFPLSVSGFISFARFPSLPRLFSWLILLHIVLSYFFHASVNIVV